jgi:hypothetical protein
MYKDLTKALVEYRFRWWHPVVAVMVFAFGLGLFSGGTAPETEAHLAPADSLVETGPSENAVRWAAFQPLFVQHIGTSHRDLAGYLLQIEPNSAGDHFQLFLTTSLYPAGAVEERLATRICYSVLDFSRLHGYTHVRVYSVNGKVMATCRF